MPAAPRGWAVVGGVIAAVPSLEDVRGREGMGGALGPCTGLSALKAGLDSHSRS